MSQQKANGGSLRLSRCLSRQTVDALFERLLPVALETGAAVVGTNGRVVSTGGRWPGDTNGDPSAIVGTTPWMDAMANGRPVEHEPFRLYPLVARSESLGALVIHGPTTGAAPAVEHALHGIMTLLLEESLTKRDLTNETLAHYREITLLYRMAETIAASRDPTVIPQLVLEECQAMIDADAGVLLLATPNGDWDMPGAFGDPTSVAALHEIAWLVLDGEPDGGPPTIISDLPGAAALFSSALWAPSRNGERLLGGVLLGRLQDRPTFRSVDQMLLSLLAGQAALAMENAQLFESLQDTLHETTETRDLLASIFRSIPSGVVTVDALGRVSNVNEAAERILGSDATAMTGKSIRKAAPSLARLVQPQLDAVAETGEPTPPAEHSLLLRGRGALRLGISCSPIREADGTTAGAMLVIEDLTTQRGREAEHEHVRRTMGRVVTPSVRDRLLASSAHTRVEGDRRAITTLFADVRQFTPYAESTPPEHLFEILNSYLTAAAEAITAEEGTLDKFIGDAVMAFWNAPDLQADHPLRAVRAGLAMQRAFEQHRATLLNADHLLFRIGIATGDAIVGNVGAAGRFNYTVIGDAVNLAQRLESTAEPGQVLLSTTTYDLVHDHVVAEPLGPVSVKGRRDPEVVYAITGLRRHDQI